MHKRQKQGLAVQPVAVEGRKIARTFWGQSWCNHLESFSDFANRLPRGRTYVRNGSVCHLEIISGKVTAIVSGSSLYDVKIDIGKLSEKKWETVKERCSGKIGSLIELLQGRLSDSVMTVVTSRHEGLFPLPGEIEMDCSCPDWAEMCKHVAAVLYGVGARLDNQPELLFLLRGVDHEELIMADAAASTFVSNGKAGKSKRIADSDLSDVFGIEMLGEEQIDTEPRTIKSKDQRSSGKKMNHAKASVSSSPAKNGGNGTTRSGETITAATGKSVRELRSRLDISQSELASLLGVSGASVSNWEKRRGLLNLQARTLAALKSASAMTQKQAWKKLGKG